MQKLFNTIFPILLAALIVLSIPTQVLGATENSGTGATVAPEDVPVREADPRSITVSTNFMLNGYRFAHRLGDDRTEVSSFLGLALVDLGFCFFVPCEDDSSEMGAALSFGVRRYFSSSRFTGYAGTNVYLLSKGIIIAKHASILPTATLGIHWQARNGFTLALGAEFFIINKDPSKGNRFFTMGQIAVMPWFATEVGWSF